MLVLSTSGESRTRRVPSIMPISIRLRVQALITKQWMADLLVAQNLQDVDQVRNLDGIERFIEACLVSLLELGKFLGCFLDIAMIFVRVMNQSELPKGFLEIWAVILERLVW